LTRMAELLVHIRDGMSEVLACFWIARRALAGVVVANGREALSACRPVGLAPAPVSTYFAVMLCRLSRWCQCRG
jgi:hypothetical protein